MKSSTNNDLSAQILGVTDRHIHYFDNHKNKKIKHAANAKTLGIHHQMLTDFQALVASAAQANIEINIASGFRSFERQLLIWNNKFTGVTAIKNSHGEPVNIAKLSQFEIIEAILLYTALPGASRHHWGCDIDIYSANLLNGQALQLEPWEYDNSGPMAKLSSWLAEHAQKFGFYFPYDSYRGGIAAEPWHLSYAPLAEQYQAIMSIDPLRQRLLQTDIAGKNSIIENLSQIFEHYINNVNTSNVNTSNINTNSH